jgi:hypothetical protein
MVVILDIAAPLVAYSVLRSAGLSAVPALLLSGVFPAAGVATRVLVRHHLDVVGALVVAGILVGTVLGLVFHSARLVLLEGSVSTGVLGAGCLGSLWTSRPLMFSFVLEFFGPDTAKGREMTGLLGDKLFVRDFRVITAVWGVALLTEAALRVVVVYNTSTTTALGISKVMPFVWAGLLTAWTMLYGAHRKRKAIQIATAAAAMGSPPS